jgi:ribosomal protein S18 acetylase RimI-like enzyme
MAAYRITAIGPEHIAGFRAVVDSVAREKRYLAMLEAPPLADVTRFVTGNIRRGHPQFVALVNDRVVGWCDVIPIDRPVCAHIGTLGLGIIGEYRGQGIGKALMQAAIAQARASGLTRIELTVRGSNLKAQTLYRNLGFVDEGRKERGARVDGEYEDVLMMGLLLD